MLNITITSKQSNSKAMNNSADVLVKTVFENSFSIKQSSLTSNNIIGSQDHYNQCLPDAFRILRPYDDMKNSELRLNAARRAYEEGNYSKLATSIDRKRLIELLSFFITHYKMSPSDIKKKLSLIDELLKNCGYALSRSVVASLEKMKKWLLGIPGKLKDLEEELRDLEEEQAKKTNPSSRASQTTKTEKQHFPTLSFPDVGNILIGAEKLLEAFGALGKMSR
jgi:hypothetical protein